MPSPSTTSRPSYDTHPPEPRLSKSFSCETQLAVTVDDLIRYHDKGLQTDIAILDFSKVFDTVPTRSYSTSWTIMG